MLDQDSPPLMVIGLALEFTFLRIIYRFVAATTRVFAYFTCLLCTSASFYLCLHWSIKMFLTIMLFTPLAQHLVIIRVMNIVMC